MVILFEKIGNFYYILFYLTSDRDCWLLYYFMRLGVKLLCGIGPV